MKSATWLLCIAVSMFAAIPYVKAQEPYTDSRPTSVTSWRHTAKISFPDGATADVLVRRTPALIGPVTASLASEYPSLVAAIRNGNIDAAFGLYVKLRICRWSPRSAEELETELASAKRNRRATMLGLPKLIVSTDPPFIADELEMIGSTDLVSDEQLARYEQDLRTRTAMCAGVSSSQLEQAESWRTFAAAHGNAWALKDIATRIPTSARSSNFALQAWDAVWGTGSIAALSWLAGAHRDGWAGAAAREADAVLHYAYLYLYHQFERSLAGALPSKIRERSVATIGAELSALEATLSATQKAQATLEMRRILANNGQCCYVD